MPNQKGLDEGRKAFVLGHPIEHSLSPALHQSAYNFLGLSLSYQRLDTRVSDLPQRFGDNVTRQKIVGYSVTMPLKGAICDFIDRVGEFAGAVGAVNTVYWRGSGERVESWGHNTDVAGIVKALEYSGAPQKPRLSAAVLGGGNTAASALVALKILGAASVDLFMRNPQKAQSLLPVAQATGLNVRINLLDSFADSYAAYDSVISSLPAGAADKLLQKAQTPTVGSLLDVAYDPWPSDLARIWKNLGGSVVSGKDLLLYQAGDQIKLFLGANPSDKFSRELEMVNTMCRAIGLEERQKLSTFSIDPHVSIASFSSAH